MVGSMHTITEHIQKNGLSDLRITGWIGLNDELRVGVIKSKANLLPAINQAINQRFTFYIYSVWIGLNILNIIFYKILLLFL